MTHTEVRNKYLEFFKKRGHKEIPSSSLVPENDPTSLFTSSGMQPLITYLLGETHPLGTRIVDSQKCFRSQDIEEIGDNRHTTFFEMLGNWSLGGYFKKEQLKWIWDFLTKELGLGSKHLYVSIFEGIGEIPKDNESMKIWKSLGVPDDRIFYYGVKKNWWSRSGEPDNMPTGEPGGPDSEVFFDFGENLGIHEKSSYRKQKCHPNCNCGRFLEIANSVFMQYQKQADGTLKELPKKNVDFGGGLERMVAATNNNPDIFQTNIFKDIINKLGEYSKKKYGENSAIDRSFRIIADHLRAAAMLIIDGVTPGNKLQGYILRKLLRRSMFHCHLIGSSLSGSILPLLCKEYQEVYTEITNNWLLISDVIDEESSRFGDSLDRGLKKLERAISQKEDINGLFAFVLYQSYGFPLELTKEILVKRGIVFKDESSFREAQKTHTDLSRTLATKLFKGGLQDQSAETTKLHTATHLLQQALRTILGIYVCQKGSNITAERLRFDFSHSAKLTDEEIQKVERLVNSKIGENLSVTLETMDLKTALDKGALTVPGVNYPEKVKVYSVGSFSKEICGGPHVDFTGRLGKFKIIKEDACASNVRRIYAILKK